MTSHESAVVDGSQANWLATGERMRAQAARAARLLKALANAQRLRILCLLLAGERSVSQLHDDIDLSQSALSQHLAVLRRMRLVDTRRVAQTVYYSVAAGPLHAIIAVLHEQYCQAPESEATREADAKSARPRRLSRPLG